MMPKMPIMAAREFHTSASSVNPQNNEGSLGSSFGGSTCNMQSEHLTYHQLSFILFRNWFFHTMCVQKSQVQFNENMNGWESGCYPCGKFHCPCYRKGLSWLWPWTSQGVAHDGSWQEGLHMQSEYLESCFSSQSSLNPPEAKPTQIWKPLTFINPTNFSFNGQSFSINLYSTKDFCEAL